MADGTQRLAAAGLIEKFVCCEITNFELQDGFPRSGDPALHAVSTFLWYAYSDIREHRLEGKYALTPEAREVFERCVLFLRTDIEYMGISTFIDLAAPFRRLWSRVRGRTELSLPPAWPFATVEQLERARRGLNGLS